MKSRPWWRDPVWIVAFGVCVLILGSTYFYVRYHRQREAIRIMAHILRMQGDLHLEDNPDQAMAYYKKAIELIKEQGDGDPRLQAEESEAQGKIDRITKAANQVPGGS